MDSLVSRYSRPAFEQNEHIEDDGTQELMDPMANLSLRFAMPPIAQVGFLSMNAA
jgi:20S proteasome subunit beta 5